MTDSHSKLEYLQNENQQLLEQVEQLNHLLQLNRQALKLYQSQPASQIPSTDDSDVGKNRGMLLVLKNQQQENLEQSKLIDKLYDERNQAQNQVDYISNIIIAEAAQKHERDISNELEQQIKDLNHQLRDKEDKICELEATKPDYDEQIGIVIKYRDIIEPSKQNLLLHGQIQQYQDELTYSNKIIEILKQDKQEMQSLNLKLTTELIKLKSTAINHHGKQLILSQSQSQTEKQQINHLVNLQKMMANNEDDDNSSNEDQQMIMSPLPLKNDVKSTNKPTLKLDLTRAKQIQEINAKRQIQQFQDKFKQNLEYQVLEKFNKLETQLDDARKSLQREMLLNKSLTEEKEELRRINHCLESRNEILAKSNQNYESKWREIYKKYQFFQSFYFENRNLAQDIPREKLKENFDISILDNPKQDSQDFIEQDEIAIEDQEQQEQREAPHIYQYYTPINLDDSKGFLIQLAKEMYMMLEDKLELMQKQSNVMRCKQRSLSNFLEYQQGSGLAKYALE